MDPLSTPSHGFLPKVWPDPFLLVQNPLFFVFSIIWIGDKVVLGDSVAFLR